MLAYLDDVVLGVPASCFADALRLLREDLAAVGHFPNPRKLEIWTPSGIPPPSNLSESERARWRPDGLTVLGLPLEHGHGDAERGGAGEEGGRGGE